MSENKESKPTSNNIYDGKVITDSLGRKLKLRNAGLLDGMDLREALGTKVSHPTNEQLADRSLYISMIDDFLLSQPPANYAEFRGNIKRIGDEGFSALFKYEMECANNNENKTPEEIQKEEIEKVKK